MTLGRVVGNCFVTQVERSKMVFLPFLKKLGHSRPLFHFSCLFNTALKVVDSKQILPMTGFKPWISDVGRDCSTNCATPSERYC